MDSTTRKLIRAEAATMPLGSIKSRARRLTIEAADLQALADAWRKAHSMEKRRRANTKTSADLVDKLAAMPGTHRPVTPQDAIP